MSSHPITNTEDVAEIVTVLTKYAEACDRRQWDLFDTILTPDVEVTYSGGTFTGRTGAVAYVRSRLTGAGPTQHLLGNFRIDIDGPSARSECAVRAWHAGTADLAGHAFELLGNYHDELRKTDAGWLISRRRLEIVASFGSPEVLPSA